MREDCLDGTKNPRAKWFRRKRVVAEAFRAAGDDRKATLLQDCQEISIQAICTSCGHVSYVRAKCRSRVCPLCAYQASKERGRMLLALTRNMAFPKLVTLTMPTWRDNPREGISYIRHAFGLLRENEVFSQVKGGAYQIELVQKPNGWHIHIHALLDAPFIPRQRLFSAWTSILNVRYASIHVTAATTDNEKLYCAKYACKAADYSGHPQSVVDWYNATHGSRLFATFGVWYHVTPDFDEDTRPQSFEPQPCAHCGAVGSLALASTLFFAVGKECAKPFQEKLASAGPPSISLW